MARRFLMTASAFAVLVLSPLQTPFAADARLSVEQLVGVQQTAEQKRAENPPALDKEQALLKEIIERGNALNLPYRDVAGLSLFYKNRNYEPLWASKWRIGKKAENALATLEDSWTHGLSPEVYNVTLLRKMIEAKLDDRQQVEFEVLLSDAVAAYGSDMTGMRVTPRSIGEDPNSWTNGITTVQVLEFVADEDTQRTDKTLAKLVPGGALYQVMRADLIKLTRDIESRPDADPPLLSAKRMIRPGDSDTLIADIRARLGHGVKAKDRNNFYDEALALSVAKFQRDHGLKPDAVIGKRTIMALNQGRRDKLIKLVANMERQRWLDPRLPSRYIVVNVPAMTLWGIEDNEIKLEMPVIVGREKRATVSFIANITGIRFNPSWNVPNTIKTEDLLPALRKDSNALRKKGIELIRYTSDGFEPIASESIDWSTMTASDIKAMGMVQNPGDDNALGRVRVLMPNKYDIYLHDTNSPELFKKDFRALSSGCVRVSDPQKLANFILSHNEGWTDKKVEGYLAKTKTIEVKAQSGLPVYILYQTVWLDENNALVYGEDIYGNDVRLVRELQKTGQISIPVKLK